MFKRSYKFLISFGIIATLFSAWSVFAYADPFAGAVTGAMGAMGATIGSTGATTGAFSDFISNGNRIDPYDNLDPLSDYTVYYQKNAKSEMVDGQLQYFDLIYYSHDFAQIFQDEGIAFLNDYSVQPNSSDILAYGQGNCLGVPIFTKPGNNGYSQVYIVGEGFTTVDGFSIGVEDMSTSSYPFRKSLTISSLAGTSGPTTKTRSSGVAVGFQIRVSNILSATTGTAYLGILNSGAIDVPTNTSYTISLSGNAFTNEPFEFDYVSAFIDMTPLASDKGLRFYIPSGTIDSSVSTGQYRYSHGSPNTEIKKINDGVTDAAANNSIDSPEFIVDPEPIPTPTPTVPPVPVDTPLGEVPYDDFIDTFGQSIYSKLDSIRNVVDTIGQRIESILEDVETAIDTAGQSIEDAIESAVGTIGGILTDIKNGILSIPQYLTQILEAVITHPLDMFDAFLDAFMEHSGIGGLLDELKERLGIWHYVVEWLQCIGGVFRFFFGIMSSVAYCMVVPIYALVAGSICLAIYKRFGR